MSQCVPVAEPELTRIRRPQAKLPLVIEPATGDTTLSPYRQAHR